MAHCLLKSRSYASFLGSYTSFQGSGWLTSGAFKAGAYFASNVPLKASMYLPPDAVVSAVISAGVLGDSGLKWDDKWSKASDFIHPFDATLKDGFVIADKSKFPPTYLYPDNASYSNIVFTSDMKTKSGFDTTKPNFGSVSFSGYIPDVVLGAGATIVGVTVTGALSGSNFKLDSCSVGGGANVIGATLVNTNVTGNAILGAGTTASTGTNLVGNIISYNGASIGNGAFVSGGTLDSKVTVIGNASYSNTILDNVSFTVAPPGSGQGATATSNFVAPSGPGISYSSNYVPPAGYTQPANFTKPTGWL